ncbi:transcriptional regulator [Echinicola pacifica]|uniref:Transcriptional regulator n=1 Tax=Echinicola pacifica TaxID=346377 RepID=A0A918UVI2_9BACT|nr:MarR family transcriptional regulator [Echinicola pacifica]GGZ38563.1 transcriptional regulator [Echinicola pacifica]
MKEINFDFDKPEDSLGYLLWQTTMQWQRQMNRALEKINLTHTQFVILAALGWLQKKSNAVTQKEIADHSNTDRMMVSKILRTLQKNELIERREHETDTRAKCVFLTPKGREILQKAIEIKTLSNNTFFSKLSDPANFGQELRKITGN